MMIFLIKRMILVLKKMIKQVFEDGNIQDHISDTNASVFYAESCFGIVFSKKSSLKISLESLNGYDFSEISLNSHGPFLDSEDSGMRTFPCESYENFVTNYLSYIAWDALPIHSMRKCVRVDGDPLLTFLFFIILNENKLYNFEGT